ncbi:MAG: 5-formyltetrahydrofolate cyclo-ligase [Desulfobacterales bacterium]|nr:5-formyltetrahydrofolate cyclo-ligase [Desulfobacterales bacterium]
MRTKSSKSIAPRRKKSVDDGKGKRSEVRNSIISKLEAMPQDLLLQRYVAVENRLFNFANFLEAKIVLLYANQNHEIPTFNIIKRSIERNKIIVFPHFDNTKFNFKLYKVENLASYIKNGLAGLKDIDTDKCKVVPINSLDIAIIPGIVFDEKGGRVGNVRDYYDKLIPHLPSTTRKVSLAIEDQIIPQMPLEAKSKHVDIIITNERVIYKI